MSGENLQQFLSGDGLIDHHHPKVVAFANHIVEGLEDTTQKAIQLYIAVRDKWRYNPYKISFKKQDLQVSNLMDREDGHCIDKAVILIACLRTQDIPARLCLAKVKNHIATGKLEEKLGTNELAPHGYVEIWLHQKWVKATPAFNRELCELIGVSPLEFNGLDDSVFQEFSPNGGQFMEYLEEYGHYADIPTEYIYKIMRENYPTIFKDKESDGINFEVV